MKKSELKKLIIEEAQLMMEGKAKSTAGDAVERFFGGELLDILFEDGIDPSYMEDYSTSDNVTVSRAALKALNKFSAIEKAGQVVLKLVDEYVAMAEKIDAMAD